jgi:glutaredoxin
MTKKLKIATLNGCSRCEEFKEILNTENIQFTEIICSNNENSLACDDFEDIVKCELYPMCIINNNTFLVFASEYSKLGKVHVNRQKNIIYCHSTDNMMQLIKKLVY